MEGMNDFDDSGNVDVKKKEKNDVVIDDSDLRRNDSDDNDDSNDSDTSFAKKNFEVMFIVVGISVYEVL